MAGEDPGDLIPRPDPSTLSLAAVAQAKDDLRREIQALRELIEAKIDSVCTEMHQTWALHNADVERERVERNALREVIFDKFNERDLRFGQQDMARKEALEMALRTARELVDTKADAAQAAADKFQEAIVRQLGESTRTNSEARDRLSMQIAELDNRVGRSEGTGAGAATSRADLRNNISVVIAAGALVLSLVLAILLYAHK